MPATAAVPASPANPTSITAWFDSRADLRAEFLARHQWADCKLEPVGEDCAFRRYFRLRHGERTLILMESVPPGGKMMTPGHSLTDFLRIDKWLRAAGLNAPDILQADEKEGYLLLEDFGDLSFKKALEQGVDASTLYGLATDVLSTLQRADDSGLNLPRYYDSHVHTGRRRVVDWFMPVLLGRKNPDGLAEDYLAEWDKIEKSLPPCPQGFLHIDYHVENLMWLPKRKLLQQCGLLDFQGAMTGPLPYDLANLLEDARVDIAPEIRQAMLDRFCRALNEADGEIFRAWYTVLAAQFHCRVIGQFIRLAVRDGKTRYLQHLPRLAGYLEAELRAPLLRPLRNWFVGQGVDFQRLPDVNPRESAVFIRPDAF